ncbi:MAG: hypothetical protein V1493_00685 [Candidatus Diapherotrites archaeon]
MQSKQEESLKAKIIGGGLVYRVPFDFYAALFFWLAFWLIPAFFGTGFLPKLEFNAIVRVVFALLFAGGLLLSLLRRQQNIKLGGMNSKHQTVTLMKGGIYGFVRHPSDFGSVLMAVGLPVALSGIVAFTPLACIGMALLGAANYQASLREEKLNLQKWGKDYADYMNEVPRWNILLGILRHYKKQG